MLLMGLAAMTLVYLRRGAPCGRRAGGCRASEGGASSGGADGESEVGSEVWSEGEGGGEGAEARIARRRGLT